MAQAVDIVVNILTKLEDAGVDQASSKFGAMGSGLKKAMVPAVAAIGVIGAFGAAAIQSASRLEQAVGATDSVFGKNASTVKKWAQTSATSVGLAKSEYLEMSNVLGAQLKNMGVPMDKVAGQTKNLTTLGADLAATFGGSTSEAVEALSSLLRGETDPIERYGVSIKQADIAARMAADGTDKLKGEQLKAAKTQATLALLTEQTADAQGAFARETDTAAHAQQVAAAQYEDAKAALGEALLPAVSKVMNGLSALAQIVKEHPALFQVLIGVVLALAVAVVVLNVAMLVMAANPVVLTIAGITAAVIALSIGLVVAYKKSETFRNIVNGVFNAVKGVALAVFNAIATTAHVVWDGISAGARTVQNIVTTVANVIRNVFTGAWNAISNAARVMWGAIQGVFQQVQGAAHAVANVVRSAITGAWDAVKTAARTVWDVVQGVFSQIRGAAANVAGALSGPLTTVWAGIKNAASTALAPITGILNGIKGAIDSVIGAVHNLIGALSNIKVPKINLPNIPGLFSAPPAPVPAAVATSPYLAPRVRGGVRAGTGQTASSGITINVTGAIDPEATARQIRRILAGHDRRVGVTR